MSIGTDWNLAYLDGQYFTGHTAGETLGAMAAFADSLEENSNATVLGVTLNYLEDLAAPEGGYWGGTLIFEEPDAALGAAFAAFPSFELQDVLFNGVEDEDDEPSTAEQLEVLTHDLADALRELSTARERAEAITEAIEELDVA